MKTWLRIIVSFITLGTGSGFASPAGVIPYACVGDEILVLMAFDPASGRLGYGAFGGGREGAETIAETAAREFFEETRCAFNSPTSADLEQLPSSNSGGFHSFVAEVPYTQILEIETHACAAELERVGWQWFRLGVLMTALSTGESRPSLNVFGSELEITLWDKAAESLRKAVQDGLLLPEQLCLK